MALFIRACHLVVRHGPVFPELLDARGDVLEFLRLVTLLDDCLRETEGDSTVLDGRLEPGAIERREECFERRSRLELNRPLREVDIGAGGNPSDEVGAALGYHVVGNHHVDATLDDAADDTVRVDVDDGPVGKDVLVGTVSDVVARPVVSQLARIERDVGFELLDARLHVLERSRNRHGDERGFRLPIDGERHVDQDVGRAAADDVRHGRTRMADLRIVAQVRNYGDENVGHGDLDVTDGSDARSWSLTAMPAR